jgi:hypothetical protein
MFLYCNHQVYRLFDHSVLDTGEWSDSDLVLRRKGKGKYKGNVHPRTCHEGPDGKERYSSTLYLTSAPDGGGW